MDDFRRGDEEVVEDVLKVLPGFDVDGDGTIRFAGKQITKVMIEGSDLFGKGYRMVTKNLDANVLEDVEVLQNYTELAELRGLEKSDDIALNLSLKEEISFELFGNVSLGMNTLERHEARMVLTSLNKKIKQYIFLNSNSLGKDLVGELNELADSDNSVFSQGNMVDLELAPRNYFSRSLLPLSPRRMRFNNSGLASYNSIFKPNSDFEFKIISLARYDEDELKRQIETKFLTEEVISRDLETLNLTDRIDAGLIKVESVLKPNISSRFEYQGLLQRAKSSATSTVIINNENLFDNYSTGIWETTHNLNYTNRIDENQALVIHAKYSRQHHNDNYVSDPLFLGDFFDSSTGTLEGQQEEEFEMTSSSLKALWLIRTGNLSFLEIDTGVSYAVIKSNLDFESPALNNEHFIFSYNNRLTILNNSFGVLGRYRLGIFNLFSGIQGSYLIPTYKVNPESKPTPEFFLIKPKIGSDWSIGQSKFQLSYIYDASLSEIREILDGFYIDDRRTVKRGLGDFHFFRGHNALFNYTYGGWLRRNMVHTTLLYNRNNRVITNDVTVTPTYSLLQNTLDTDRELYLANISADILLPSLKNNLKLSGSITSTNFESLYNNEFYTIRTSIKAYGLSFRSVFDGLFNYTLGASWLHQNLNISSSEVRTKGSLYSDLYFEPSRTLKFQFVAEREAANQQGIKSTTYLMDAYMHLQVKPNKLKLTAEARNLLNNKYFVSNSLNGLMFTSTRYNLIPRSFLLSVNYRL
ncbi:hypothetical protein [Halalkalibaculum roseum]|uniref:hypothetical protein n=1 Tax=Halalkalibaculum roseum TaxID=2709311 RepID=UPI00201218FA|nr:hypothetical protein [Halalkalibaculum roseum]